MCSEGQRKHIADRAQVGDLVRIAGRLKDSSYEWDGATHYTTDRIVEEFGILAPKGMPGRTTGEGRAKSAAALHPFQGLVDCNSSSPSRQRHCRSPRWDQARAARQVGRCALRDRWGEIGDKTVAQR